jgi:hypothetical protein
MAAVRMYIEKFGREVLIDEDHPLAVAQRQQGAQEANAPIADSASGDGDPVDLTDVDLDALTKEELIALAIERGVTVTRADGADGVPLKSDYIAALSG